MQKLINPKMIGVARNLRGLSQKNLSDMANFTQGKLSKLENGFLQCSQDDIEVLAKCLHLPVQFFYEEMNLYGIGLSLMYRKKRRTSVKEMKYMEALFQLRRMQVAKLIQSIDFGATRFVHFDVTQDTPEEIAQKTRAMLNVPLGPIENIVHLIEEMGGIIFTEHNPDSDIDAVSQWIHNTSMNGGGILADTLVPPLFYYNSAKPMDRVRFSLAHELGHILMHSSGDRVPSETMEDEANRFAAEFLMPRADIKPQLRDLTLKKLPPLKISWKVSMQALIYRAAELSCITQNQKQYMFQKFSSWGFRKREPEQYDPPMERPSLIREMIDIHTRDLEYTHSEIMHLLNCSEEVEFDELYGKRRLRAV